jgi:hypothetical protein
MHFLNYIWINYFWSSDKGNGPEGLQQTALYGAIALLFVPVVRRWIKHVHAKLDHIIQHHPDIPSFHHPDFPSVHSVTPAHADVHDALAHDAAAVPFPPAVPTDGTVAP